MKIEYILVAILILGVISYLIFGHERLPKFNVLYFNDQVIRFMFDGVEHSIMKQMTDTFKSNTGYILIASSDRNGATFNLYKDDNLIRKYGDVYFPDDGTGVSYPTHFGTY